MNMHDYVKMEDTKMILAEHHDNWGSYVGIIMNVVKTKYVYKANVYILDVFKYPEQRSILQKGVPYERKPFAYGSTHEFLLENICDHALGVGRDHYTEKNYIESCKFLIKKELQKYGCVDAYEKEILLMHLDELCPSYSLNPG
jgi:hypothetical protein